MLQMGHSSKREKTDPNGKMIAALILFGLIFARYCYFGFHYYIQLDDYIQYHKFSAFDMRALQILASSGSLSARPLAGILDVAVWSKLYGRLLIAVAAVSAMYAVSAVLLRDVFHRHFGTGYVFCVIYALLPLGFEGTYWLSASSRIVVGLFFAAISLRMFDEWCEFGKRRFLVLFFLFQLLAFCLYEQVALFSCAATIVVMLCCRKEAGKRAKAGFLFFVSGAGYFAVTRMFPGGINTQRTALLFPWQDGYVTGTLKSILQQLHDAFVSASAGIMGKGFCRGASLIASEPHPVWLLLAAGLCIALFLLCRKAPRRQRRVGPELLAGLFLAAAPLAVFFVLASPWFGLRNTVTSFCGIGLLADALVGLFVDRSRNSLATGEAVLTVLLVILFGVSSVSELCDYRQTTQADTRICKAAVRAADDSGLSSSAQRDHVWLLNVDASYVSNGNFYYHEHDFGVTSSDWALTGAIVATANRKTFLSDVFTPLSRYRTFAAAENELQKMKLFWYNGSDFVPVSLQRTGNAYAVLGASNERYGTITSAGSGSWQLS